MKNLPFELAMAYGIVLFFMGLAMGLYISDFLYRKLRKEIDLVKEEMERRGQWPR